MKDHDLEKIFFQMKLQEPTSQQLTGWKRILQNEMIQKSKKNIASMWWQWLIAGSIGFASATIYFKNLDQSHNLDFGQKKFDESATYEYIYDK